jgi:transposase
VSQIVKKKKKKKKKRKKNEEDSKYISIDPGLIDLLTCMEFKLNNYGQIQAIETFTLSKVQYDNLTGSTKFKQKKKLLKNQHNSSSITKHSTDQRTAEIDLKILQNEMNHDRYKQHSIDTWINNHICCNSKGIRTPDHKILIVFGGAKFDSVHGAPTTSLLTALQRRFTVVQLDEFFTTQRCSLCTNQLECVYDTESRVIREVKFCKSCKCNIDRDKNACLNIAKASVGWSVDREGNLTFGRPNYLRNPYVHHQNNIIS